MNQNMIPGERLTPCPMCGEPTIVRDRVYSADGYPYVHGCPSQPLKVPNERDFCICGTLTWGGLCEDCQKQPTKQAVRIADNLTRITDDELAQRMNQALRGPAEEYERLRGEANRRIKVAERDERERKRRAIT